jgi:hypothetical protein
MVLVNGTVSADGRSKGAGAGGSILVECDRFEGIGRLRANGGDGHKWLPGGGGGRIAVRYRGTGYTGAYECAGGTGSSGRGLGAPGTLDLPPGTHLTVSDDVGLAPGTHHFGSLTVTANARLVFHGDPSTGRGCAVKVDGDLTVEAGASISADHEGYGVRKGPGGASGHWRNGGTHGGRARGNPHRPYGSAEAPVTLGSGGGLGRGGGAIKVTASGTVRVNGAVTADGQSGNGTGAGAGGSIFIVCERLEGSGRLRANGAGGGRIAVYFRHGAFTGRAEAKGIVPEGEAPKDGRDEDGSVILRKR